MIIGSNVVVNTFADLSAGKRVEILYESQEVHNLMVLMGFFLRYDLMV